MGLAASLVAGILANRASSEIEELYETVQKHYNGENSLKDSFEDRLSIRIENRAEEINSYALGNVTQHWSIIANEVDIYESAFKSEQEIINLVIDEVRSNADLNEEEIEELRIILADEFAATLSDFRKQIAKDDELQRKFQAEFGIQVLKELESITKSLNHIVDPGAYDIFEFPSEKSEIVDTLLPGEPIPFVNRNEVPESPELRRHVLLGPAGSGKTRIIAERIKRLQADAVDQVLILKRRFLSQEDARALGRQSFDGDLLLVWEDLHKVNNAGEGDVVERTLRELSATLGGDQNLYTLLEARSGRLEDLPGNIPKDFKNEDSFWSGYKPIYADTVQKQPIEEMIRAYLQKADGISLSNNAFDALVERTCNTKSAPKYIKTVIQTAEDNLTYEDILELPDGVTKLWRQKPYPKLRENSPSEWTVLVAMKLLYDFHIPACSQLVYYIYSDFLNGDLSLFESAVNKLVDRQWLVVTGDSLLSSNSVYYVHDTQLEAIATSAWNRPKPLSNLLHENVDEAVPRDARELIYLYIGGSLFENGEYSLAEDHWRAAVQIGDRAVSYFNYGIILSDVYNEAEKAADYFETAIEIDSEYAEAHTNYGVLLMNDLHKPKNAAHHFKKALKIKADYVYAHIHYSIFLRRVKEDYDSAEWHIRKAIFFDPQEPEAYFQYGRLLNEKLEKPKKAEDYFAKAFRLDEEYAEKLASLPKYIGKYPQESPPIRFKKIGISLKPESIKFGAEIPPTTSIEVTVMQDTTGDGTVDNQQLLKLKDGTHRYKLNQFEAGDTQIWVEVVMKSEYGLLSANIDIESFSIYGN